MKSWLQTIAVFSLMVFLAGCGNVSLFKGLSNSKSQSAIDQIKSNNNKGTDYSTSVSLADQVINSSAASTSDKQTAQLLKGEALLGKNGVKAVEVASKLLSSTQPTANLLSVLPTISAADAISAAKALNAADSLSASTNASIGSNYQVTRAMANTLAIVSKVNEVYDIGNDGTVTAKNNVDVKAALSTLMASDSDGKTLDYYANQAKNGFDKGGTLSSDQQSELDKVKDVPTKLKLLNEAVQGGEPYQYTDSNNHTITIFSTSDNNAVQGAINDIMKKANK